MEKRQRQICVALLKQLRKVEQIQAEIRREFGQLQFLFAAILKTSLNRKLFLYPLETQALNLSLTTRLKVGQKMVVSDKLNAQFSIAANFS